MAKDHTAPMRDEELDLASSAGSAVPPRGDTESRPDFSIEPVGTGGSDPGKLDAIAGSQTTLPLQLEKLAGWHEGSVAFSVDSVAQTTLHDESDQTVREWERDEGALRVELKLHTPASTAPGTYPLKVGAEKVSRLAPNRLGFSTAETTLSLRVSR